MIITAFDLVQMLVGVLIGWRSLCAMNAMSGSSHHGVRLLHWLLAMFAAGMVVAPLYGGALSDTFKLSALATFCALTLIDRRRVG